MSDASKIKKLTQREHILQLPDTYIGSRDSHMENRWIYNPTENKMEWREVNMNPGLFKIFDEIIVNALDHVVRSSTKVTALRVSLSKDSFSVFNDGEGLPVMPHPDYKVMVPELIFGQLLTSSNYDETEEKTVGGKNGYGAKLTNIYSTHFIVKTGDGVRKFYYEQNFRDNMSVIEAPLIKKLGTMKPFTEITAFPDIKRFYPECDGIPDDMLAIMLTRVIDAAALCSSAGVAVSYSIDKTTWTRIPLKSFESYVKLFIDGGSVYYERCGPRWEMAAVLTRYLHADGVPDDRHISFVNGIFTRRGGKHVDAVTRSVLGAFCEGPGKKLDLKPAQLKDAVTFFVNATIVNPSFDSQTKETLTTPAAKFGSVFKVSDALVAKLAKDGGLLEEAQAILDARHHREAKKTDGKRTVTVRGIPKLEDASWAGTAKSIECTLILTEGDSAASTAISGLKVVGRERYGVFPLKGKILNVKDASIDKKSKNEELTRIKRILGLEHGKRYKDLKALRYSRVMIMTDQDVDGSHIKGLLINLFHTEWPELLQLGFLCCLMTPLLKVSKGAQTFCFYSASEFEKWSTAVDSPYRVGRWTTKYYKGLGTSTAAEAREYFVNMNTVRFQWDDAADGNIDLAFNKKRADDRKEWLSTYDRGRTLDVPSGGADVSYSRFVNDELIHFSNADNLRSLPHVMDGLKPSQRKILWASRKRNLVSEIKVAQLAGYVSETAAYHHGEVSLTAAIVGMAQNFVGANNINLLVPNGQFGTRLQGGDDAASPRYIFTALEPIVSALFSKADDPGLSWLDDDGQTVEPEYYLPVIPMLLVNGCIGIGTGFSTEVLPYSPRDLVTALRSRLTGDSVDLSETRLVPHWDGFRGSVIPSADAKQVTTKGVYQFIDDDSNRVRITELPVGTWTKTYKAFLEELLGDEKGAREAEGGSVGRYLKSFQEAYNDVDVEFILTLDADYCSEARAFPAEFEKKFKLVSSYRLSNMVAFDVDGHIRRFDGTGAILESFYSRRLRGYIERKASELARLDAEIVEVDARAAFVRAVVTGTLKVANAADDDLLAGLLALGLPPLSKPDEKTLASFEYLLRMRIDRLKAKAVTDLEQELATLKESRDLLASKSPESLWLTDLNVFSGAFEVFQKAREATRVSEPKVVKKVKAKNH
jgi:DNA topoisomerase-2